MAGSPARPAPAAGPEWVGLAAGLLAIAAVHLAQMRGMVPCALCYLERWPYRLAIVVALAGLVSPAVRRVSGWLLVLCLAAAAAFGIVHAGVEWGWWKSPLPECAAPALRMGSIRDMLASMPARPVKACDDPTFPVPGLPVSFAQMNVGYALVCAGLVAICSRCKTRTR